MKHLALVTSVMLITFLSGCVAKGDCVYTPQETFCNLGYKLSRTEAIQDFNRRGNITLSGEKIWQAYQDCGTKEYNKGNFDELHKYPNVSMPPGIRQDKIMECVEKNTNINLTTPWKNRK